jgi:hypothetical protein
MNVKNLFSRILLLLEPASLLKVIGHKTKIAVAIILAITTPFLLLEITCTLAPDQALQQMPPPQPNPKPESLLSQIIWIAQWIGLAAVIAIASVGLFLLITHKRKNKKQ